MSNRDKLVANSFTKSYRYFLTFFRTCGFLIIYPKNFLSKCVQNLLRIVYLIFAISSLISFIIYIKTIKREDTRSLSTMTLKGLFLVNLITTLTSFLQSEISKNIAKNLLNKFDQIDRILVQKIMLTIDYQKEIKHTRITVGLSIFCFLIVSIIVLGQAYKTPKSYTIIVLRKIAGFLIFVRCMQYLFFVQILKFRLAIVNDAIEELLVKRVESKDIFTVVQFSIEMNNKRHKTENLMYKQLMLLKMVHDELWQCCQLINDFFGWSILIIVSAFFIDFTLYGYFLILYFLRGTAKITYGEIFGNACPKLFALLVICYVIQSCENEVILVLMKKSVILKN